MAVRQFTGHTAAQLYEDALYYIKHYGVTEPSRGGDVLTIQEPVVLTLTNPRARIIDDPVRRANPFFHMMEFIWMMAGRSDSQFLEQYNSQMAEYANNGMLNAAYGWRWRKRWKRDQIATVISKLRTDPATRQAVLAMWDPEHDNDIGMKDRACNTHIYFRVVNNRLNATVCNRSNDLIWGALGANICHLTMLHELIAHFSGIELGTYSVFTNNLHVYKSMPRFEELMDGIPVEDIYTSIQPESLFCPEDPTGDAATLYADFVKECEIFCDDMGDSRPNYEWTLLDLVAKPMQVAWYDYKNVGSYLGKKTAESIGSLDWQMACTNWMDRRSKRA